MMEQIQQPWPWYVAGILIVTYRTSTSNFRK